LCPGSYLPRADESIGNLSHLCIPDWSVSLTKDFLVSWISLQQETTLLSISFTQGIGTRGMTTDDYDIFLLFVLKEIITLLFQQLIVIEISASCNDDSVFRD
jgi:hypothetical protein